MSRFVCGSSVSLPQAQSDLRLFCFRITASAADTETIYNSHRQTAPIGVAAASRETAPVDEGVRGPESR